MAYMQCAFLLTKSLDLPMYFSPSIMYKLRSLVSLEDYEFGQPAGGGEGLDTSHL
jgi:hypothetical protein